VNSDGEGGTLPLASPGTAYRRGPRKGNIFPLGYCHFPKYSEEYFKRITAEQLVTKIVKGYRRHEWQKMRERNEALDCRVYPR
jgi:phage terminase large subunit GpA-like protein